MSSAKHLSRKDLIRIARTRTESADRHLAECAECREAYEALAKYHPVVGHEPLPAPPKELVRMAKAIGHQSGASRLVELVAHLVFDSWASPVPVGVRGPAVESNRRLHFQADDITLELRAEKRPPGWSFVAQCSGSSESCVLKADGEVIVPDDLGVFQWKSTRPPRRISLYSPSRHIELADLKWKRTKSS